MRTSDQINEIATALNKAQAEMKPAIKDSINPHFKSTFANFSSVWDAIRFPITANNLTVLQDVFTEEKGVSVLTRIIHVTGQWIEFGPLTIPTNRHDAHAVGSAASYAKRYALCAALGVTSDDDDDDGNEAAKKPSAKISDQEYKQFCENHELAHGEIFNKFVLACLDSSSLSKKEMVASYIKNYDTFKKKLAEFGIKHGSKGMSPVQEVSSSVGISQDGEI